MFLVFLGRLRGVLNVHDVAVNYVNLFVWVIPVIYSTDIYVRIVTMVELSIWSTVLWT